MDSNKVDMYITSMRDNFNSNDIPIIKASLEKISDDKFIVFQSINYKSPVVAIVLSLLLGCFGIDRFYIGNVLFGILKLITFGGLGIWTIVDWFLIMGATKKVNFKKFMNQVNITG